MKKAPYIFTGIFILSLIFSGCDALSQKAATEKTDNSTSLSNPLIKPEIDLYTPSMNSTVGIGLNVTFNGGKDAKYHWTTDYGYFVSWSSPDFKVVNLGKEVTNNGEKIYWSFSELDAKSHDFKVNLVIEGIKTDKPLQTTLNGLVDDKGRAKFSVN